VGHRLGRGKERGKVQRLRRNTRGCPSNGKTENDLYSLQSTIRLLAFKTTELMIILLGFGLVVWLLFSFMPYCIRVSLIQLSMYHTYRTSGSTQTYFRWKEDICNFIETHWDFLTPGKHRTQTWHNTVASALSTCTAFLSGAELMKTHGWWSMKEFIPPDADDPVPIPSNRGDRRVSTIMKRMASCDAYLSCRFLC
jgi:hypothetical protein